MPAARAYKVGYARVSTVTQKLDAQLDALSDYFSRQAATR